MTDFSGDDWDDSPYEHNAGIAYDEYVREYVDVVVPFNMELDVLEKIGIIIGKGENDAGRISRS
jgi:hypothetical protein